MELLGRAILLCWVLLRVDPRAGWRWAKGRNPCHRKEPNIHDEDRHSGLEGEQCTFIFHELIVSPLWHAFGKGVPGP